MLAGTVFGNRRHQFVWFQSLIDYSLVVSTSSTTLPPPLPPPPHLLRYSAKEKISEEQACRVVDSVHHHKSDVVRMAMRHLNDERSDLKKWGRTMVEYFMVERAKELNIRQRTGIRHLTSVDDLKIAWGLSEHSSDSTLTNAFYDVIFGQFKNSVRESLSPALLNKALSFLSADEVQKTDFTEYQAVRLSLLECLAARYQLTHFCMPFVYLEQHACAAKQAKTMPSNPHGEKLPLGVTQNGKWYAGFVAKVMSKCRCEVADRIWKGQSRRICVSVN